MIDEEADAVRSREAERIDGDDAKKTTGVKHGEIIGCIARVQEDSADEKSGEDEKQINAAPSEAARSLDVGPKSSRRGCDRGSKK